MTALSRDAPLTLETIDAHTAGEPLRLIVDGLGPIPGRTMLDKRRYFRKELDHVRTALIHEPRGHADMYGAVLTEPCTADGHLGVLFMHNEGYSSMCGHGVIALTTIILQQRLHGFDLTTTELRFDTPAGRVVAHPRVVGERVAGVTFHNVPSFVAALDQTIEVPSLGPVTFDLAFGGAYYALCRAEPLGLALTTGDAARLIDAGRRIKRAIVESTEIVHPIDDDLGFLYGVIFLGPPLDDRRHSRNVCVFADGQIDRSPTGTGVSARAAVHVARGELALGQTITIESILGTTMNVTPVERTTFGPYTAVLPAVGGRAFITGQSQFIVDSVDPLAHGFFLR